MNHSSASTNLPSLRCITQRALAVPLGVLLLASCTFTKAPGPAPEEIGRPLYPADTEVKAGALEVAHEFSGQYPVGVAVTEGGRIFVNYPRWEDPVSFAVTEIRDGREIPYPSADFSRGQKPEQLYSVQAIRVDPANRLWILDTGSLDMGPIRGQDWVKLLAIDLKSNKVVKTIHFPKEVAHSSSYLNDVRFDLSRGKAGYAFITDSSMNGPNAIIVVDLASGKSWRRLDDHESVKAEKSFVPIVEGKPLMLNRKGEMPKPATVGVDGISITPDGKRLFYCPLSGHTLYSVSVDALVDRKLTDEQVAKTVKSEDKIFASDGLDSDAAGRLYLTDWEHNAVVLRDPSGRYTTLVQAQDLWWPDTMALSTDGYLYLTATQLQRLPKFNNGTDKRERPFKLYRLKVNAQSAASAGGKAG